MTVSHDHFQLTRNFAISPDRLWSLLTDPKARELWSSPSDDDVLVVETTDLREGGTERQRCGPADNPEYVVETHWYQIDGPTQACFSESVIAGGMRIGVTLVTYVLAASGDGTELTIDVSLASLTGEKMTDDFHGGWNSGLDRLERLIKEGAFA